MNYKRVLIASSFFPYPPNFGGVYDILGRIIELHKLGYRIDLAYSEKHRPEESNIDYLSKYIDNFFFVKRANKIFDLLSPIPLQVKSRTGFSDINLTSKYNLLIIEGDYASTIINNRYLKTDRIALRVHNNESLYFENLSKSVRSPYEKIYYFSESIKFNTFSKQLYSKVDRLWFISSDEYKAYRTLGGNKGVHLPAPINLSDFKYNNTLNTSNVLFIGALFMPNNLEAISWYLDNIHEFILKEFPEYIFIIAGSTGRFSENYYKNKFKRYSNVQLHFNLDSLDDVYMKASVFVNPMLHGAGVKIKSIHAIINGLPLVATHIGSEGIGLIDGETFIFGDTPTKFKDGLISLLKDIDLRKNIAYNAQQFLICNNSANILNHELSSFK